MKIMKNSRRGMALLLCAGMLCASFSVYAGAETITIADSAVPLAGTALVRVPAASGTTVYTGEHSKIDASNLAEGYVMVKYTGSVSKVKLQLSGPNGVTYSYNLHGGYEVFPLTAGNGSYSIKIYENVHTDQYALAQSQNVNVSISNPLTPFLYPNQYVNFNANSNTVAKGNELAGSAADELGIVTNVYNYVIQNITYDTAKANSVKSGYVPVVDSVLASGKGICFDYAAVMATMLRTQNIPTRLEVGYASGGIYHAWVSVHLTGSGWVNGIIQFDGKTWKLMDPTFASNGNSSAEIMQFIGTGSNYSTKYVY